MKKCRLDQILYQLGYASDEEIKRALINQKQHGGRLGSNLLEMKYITEEQLAQALSLQYDVPAFHPPPGGRKPPAGLLEKAPAEFAAEHLVLPVRYDPGSGSLSIVIADPEDAETISSIGGFYGCSKVAVSIAPESVIKKLIMDWYGLGEPEPGQKESIALPDLFQDDRADGPAPAEESAGDEVRLKNVLMVSDSAFLKNFLAPIFEREGLRLRMLSSKKEVLEALDSGSVDHVILSQDKSEEFDSWIGGGAASGRLPEVSIFSSVSSAILDNPVPYSVSISTTVGALRLAAENRRAPNGPPVPYDMICRDVDALALEAGLSRIARDGMRMASMLLAPVADSIAEAAPGRADSGPPSGTGCIIDHARELRFPWMIGDVLQSSVGLLSGQKRLDDQDEPKREVSVGAQILTLVMHRHIAMRDVGGGIAEAVSQIRTGLRDCAGHLATSEIVESYIRLIENDAGSYQSAPFQQIFIIGDVDSAVDQFASRLKNLGYHLVRIYDVDEAKRMSERLSPTAILIDAHCYRSDVSRCSELFETGESVPIFAATRDYNPSQILDLFDSGFDEVFAPPFDLDIVAARIARTIGSRSASAGQGHKTGGFSADFSAFSFMDLIQALSQSLRSVRIALTGPAGEKAEIFMDNGRPVYAECGRLAGVEAIYQAITWQENGSFVVEPCDEFPPSNIEAPMSSILMEGCRLLDESRV